MKTLVTIICFLFILKTNLIAQIGQCSVNQSLSYMGNGVVQINTIGHVPSGALPSVTIVCDGPLNSYQDFSDTIVSTQHTFLYNGV